MWNVEKLKKHIYKKNTFNWKDFKVLLAKKKKKYAMFFDDENAGSSKKNKKFCDDVMFVTKWNIMHKCV